MIDDPYRQSKDGKSTTGKVYSLEKETRKSSAYKIPSVGKTKQQEDRSRSVQPSHSLNELKKPQAKSSLRALPKWKENLNTDNSTINYSSFGGNSVRS